MLERGQVCTQPVDPVDRAHRAIGRIHSVSMFLHAARNYASWQQELFTAFPRWTTRKNITAGTCLRFRTAWFLDSSTSLLVYYIFGSDFFVSMIRGRFAARFLCCTLFQAYSAQRTSRNATRPSSKPCVQVWCCDEGTCNLQHCEFSAIVWFARPAGFPFALS